jgi:hypothetical protein
MYIFIYKYLHIHNHTISLGQALLVPIIKQKTAADRPVAPLPSPTTITSQTFSLSKVSI